MDMYDDEDAVADFLGYCSRVAARMAEYYVEAGMDVIAVVDPLISQISEDHFEQFMHEPFSGLFAHIRELGGVFFLLCVRGCDQEYRSHVPYGAGFHFH